MDKLLSVRLNGKPIGTLEQDSIGKMKFTYIPGADKILSLSLPLREQIFEEHECKAYFGGLLPEGDNARKAIGKKFGVNPKNDFSLLKAIGADCAGAVSFHNTAEPIIETSFIPLKGKQLSENKLADYIKDLPRKPLFIGAEGMKLSLAGAQDKAAICMIDNQVTIPTDGCPSTHILKPAIADLDETIENEYICLRTAKQLGINSPNVEIRHANKEPYLLIERYDREVKMDKTIKRIHQEDFCQALGVVSAYKYQSSGGPDLNQCFNLLKKVTFPAIDRKQFVERIVFNFLIGNTDAHGKNFSLLHFDNNQIKLASAYDILCTQVYPDLSKKMAMKVGGNYYPTKVLKRHWEQLCSDTGYSSPQLEKIIKTQSKNLLPVLEKEIQLLKDLGLNTNVAYKILKTVEANCKQIQSKFAL